MPEKRKFKWVFIVPGASIVVLFFLFAPFLIKTFVAEAFKMPSVSMEPSILVGDHFLTDKSINAKGDLKRGDVLIFEYPKDPRKIFIKRAIGFPGDSIEIRDKKLYINDELQEENYIIHAHDHVFKDSENNRDNFGPFDIPENCFFMMGDNRDYSNDSRFWGPVNLGNIKGKAGIIYWSWDKTNNRVRWNRIGKSINNDGI